MLEIFVKVFWFLLPPMIVNGSLNLLNPLRRKSQLFLKLDKPIDFGKNFFDGKRMLGDSTTFPGIFVALIVGLTVGWVFYKSFIAGPIIGTCTYLGHAFGSFIKRGAGIEDHKFLPIIDHSDYIILNGIIWMLLGLLSFKIFLISWITTLIVHPIFCYLGYKLGIRTRIL